MANYHKRNSIRAVQWDPENAQSFEDIKKLIAEYPDGTRIRLVKMDDVQAPPIGTEGTVVGVDGIGSLIMHWDNGSSLHVVYGEDEVVKI